MGVYIKGMKMPYSCAECRLLGTCAVVGRWITPSTAIRLSEERHTECPLVEVKEPHGRLIDEDEVLDTVKRLKSFPWGDDKGNKVPLMFEPYEVERVIKQSPTVIEGSKE